MWLCDRFATGLSLRAGLPVDLWIEFVVVIATHSWAEDLIIVVLRGGRCSRSALWRNWRRVQGRSSHLKHAMEESCCLRRLVPCRRQGVEAHGSGLAVRVWRRWPQVTAHGSPKEGGGGTATERAEECRIPFALRRDSNTRQELH